MRRVNEIKKEKQLLQKEIDEEIEKIIEFLRKNKEFAYTPKELMDILDLAYTIYMIPTPFGLEIEMMETVMIKLAKRGIKADNIDGETYLWYEGGE